MFPHSSTLTGYSETTTTAELPTLDLATVAVAAERHVDIDGVSTEVSLSTVANGVVVNTECLSPAAARLMAAALLSAAAIADGIR